MNICHSPFSAPSSLYSITMYLRFYARSKGAGHTSYGLESYELPYYRLNVRTVVLAPLENFLTCVTPLPGTNVHVARYSSHSRMRVPLKYGFMPISLSTVASSTQPTLPFSGKTHVLPCYCNFTVFRHWNVVRRTKYRDSN